MSSSFANQTLAQIELWTKRDSGQYPIGVDKAGPYKTDSYRY